MHKLLDTHHSISEQLGWKDTLYILCFCTSFASTNFPSRNSTFLLSQRMLRYSRLTSKLSLHFVCCGTTSTLFGIIIVWRRLPLFSLLLERWMEGGLLHNVSTGTDTYTLFCFVGQDMGAITTHSMPHTQSHVYTYDFPPSVCSPREKHMYDCKQELRSNNQTHQRLGYSLFSSRPSL